jgi:hypothetical protein
MSRVSWAKCRTFALDSRTLDLLNTLHKSNNMNTSLITKILINALDTKMKAICNERKPIIPSSESSNARMLDLSLFMCSFHHMKKAARVITYHVNCVLLKIIIVDKTWCRFWCQNRMQFTFDGRGVCVLCDQSFLFFY